MPKTNVVPLAQGRDFFSRRAKARLDKGNYLQAIGLLRTALQENPQDDELRLLLADAFTCIGHYEQSNQVLYEIMRREPIPPKCFLGLGANYLALEEIDNAQAALESYLRLEPDGEFVDEAYEMLEEVAYIREEYEDDLEGKLLDRADDARDAIDRGDFDEAIDSLQQLLREDPDAAFARNDLTEAYFYRGDTARARLEAERVLSADPRDIQANCNMAMISYHSPKGNDDANRYMDAALKTTCQTDDDLYKVCTTLLELERFDEAVVRLKELLSAWPYDITALHYYAVACHNSGRHQQAEESWGTILSIDPNDPVAAYYLSYSRENPESFVYFWYQLPSSELHRKTRAIRQSLHEKPEILRQRLQDPADELKILVLFGLYYSDDIMQKAVLNILGTAGGKTAENLLRDFLLHRDEPLVAKKIALGLLEYIQAEPPFVAYMGDSLVEVHINIVKGDTPLPKGYEQVPQLTLTHIENTVPDMSGAAQEIMKIWITYIETLAGKYPLMPKKEPWAAALEAVWRMRRGQNCDLHQIAEEYQTTLLTLKHHFHALMSALPEEKE